MEKTYFVTIKGQMVGPLSKAQLNDKIQSQECQWTDYIFDNDTQDWVMLMDHKDCAEAYKSTLQQNKNKPEGKPTQPGASQASASGNEELKDRAWFILKSGNNYGPFSKLEIVQMLQERTLFEFDYIWAQKLPAWKRVAEVEDFNPGQIKTLKESGMTEVSEVFFRRRHARVNYGCSLIVHNNKSVFKGKAMEISAGGAGILIENPNFQPGQTIFLHFQPGDGVPPFNAVCEIVSKQTLKDTLGLTNPVRYGVRFTSITQSVKETIKEFTTQKAAA